MSEIHNTAERLADALALTPSEAAIMARLARCRTWLAPQLLNDATASASRMYDHAADGRRVGALRVHIHNLRWKLGRDAILCMADRGYTLGAPGVLAVKAALAGLDA